MGAALNGDKLPSDGMTVLEPAEADRFAAKSPGAADGVDRLGRSQRLLREAIQGERPALIARRSEFFHAKIFGPRLHLHGTSLSASLTARRLLGDDRLDGKGQITDESSP